jgi:hypothetical protein
MKKLLLITILTVNAANASTVTLKADILNFIHCKTGHYQQVYGLHNVYINNNTPNAQSYHYEFKVCVENYKCESHSGNINLNAYQISDFKDRVNLNFYTNIEGDYATYAETTITGDGYWHAIKRGNIEVTD